MPKTNFDGYSYFQPDSLELTKIQAGPKGYFSQLKWEDLI